MTLRLVLDGGYDKKQTVPGELADFNMWDKEMTVEQLNSKTCGVKGNIVSWSSLKERGISKRDLQTFPKCK